MQPLIDFLIAYFTLGIFIGTICTLVQYHVLKPWAELHTVGWIFAVVLWPWAVVMTICILIKKGW